MKSLGDSFSERVYELLRQVPAGRVTTYGALARALGGRAYRAVGQVLRKNPYAPLVPCHRVVKSDGMIGGFGGERKGAKVEEKIRLLEKEGVVFLNGRVLNFRKLFWDFS